MFGGNNKQSKRNAGLDSLVGNQTKICGDIRFSGGLHIDGEVKGQVIGDSENSMLTTSPDCRIEGDVFVHNIILNGEVMGDVHAFDHVELAANARVTGNVYYKVIEMMMGAEVNGSMIHVVDGSQNNGSRGQSQSLTRDELQGDELVDEVLSSAGAVK